MKIVILKNLENPKALTEYLNNMQDVYKIINEHKPKLKWNVLIVLDDMIADMISNKKLNQLVRELFIRGIKLNTSTVYITQSYFPEAKHV